MRCPRGKVMVAEKLDRFKLEFKMYLEAFGIEGYIDICRNAKAL